MDILKFFLKYLYKKNQVKKLKGLLIHYFQSHM